MQSEEEAVAMKWEVIYEDSKSKKQSIHYSFISDNPTATAYTRWCLTLIHFMKLIRIAVWELLIVGVPLIFCWRFVGALLASRWQARLISYKNGTRREQKQVMVVPRTTSCWKVCVGNGLCEISRELCK